MLACLTCLGIHSVSSVHIVIHAMALSLLCTGVCSLCTCFLFFVSFVAICCGASFFFFLVKGLRMVTQALWRSEACAGSPTKAQPLVPLISTMHGQPFLIPLITWNII